MQITVEQSATLTSATSGSRQRAVVQQKLRAFEDEIQFVVVSVFKSTSTTSNASFEAPLSFPFIGIISLAVSLYADVPAWSILFNNSRDGKHPSIRL